MRYLFDDWDKLKSRLNNKYIILFLDYDGTLTSIVETPSKAVISQNTKDLLIKLSASHYCKIVIISGRSLRDIKALIGLKDIIYAGNHGLEIEGPKIKFESQVSPRLKSIIQNITTDIQKRLSGIKGALIEDKELTLSIHYRLVGKKDLPVFNKVISEVTDPYTMRNEIKVNSGKKVYEIRPSVKWDKGKAVLRILARQKFILDDYPIMPIYLGDDVTDEDAFGVLKNKGLTIYVGKPKKSQAKYYLKDTQEVLEFLKKILCLCKN